jgi:hypothetical protein
MPPSPVLLQFVFWKGLALLPKLASDNDSPTAASLVARSTVALHHTQPNGIF